MPAAVVTSLSFMGVSSFWHLNLLYTTNKVFLGTPLPLSSFSLVLCRFIITMETLVISCCCPGMSDGSVGMVTLFTWGYIVCPSFIESMIALRQRVRSPNLASVQ